MATLVVGASGATGKHLVGQLLNHGQRVKVMVRRSGIIPDAWKNNDKVEIINVNISEIGVDEMTKYLDGCQSVASCLGHTISLTGIFGKPRKLVADAVKLLCSAIQKQSVDKPIRFVLMNTAGNLNKDLNERISLGERMVLGLVRLLIPPQSDNENAANFLRLKVGRKHRAIEWVVVRPDTLINEGVVTEYTLSGSPVRSAIFNPGKTSRINVANFMSRLIVEDGLWDTWKGQMPVIYNKGLSL